MSPFDKHPAEDEEDMMSNLEKRLQQYKQELKLSQINETRKNLQESAGSHHLNTNRQTGNFGNHQKSKLSNRRSRDEQSDEKPSSQRINSIENILDKKNVHLDSDYNIDRHQNNTQLRSGGRDDKFSSKGKVKFKEKPSFNNTPRRDPRRRDRRGTRTDERYDNGGKEKRIKTLPEDRSKSKKKKGFMGNFMEMLGFGCCGTR